MPALPEAIPAPMPKKLLPVRPGNLLSGVGCQLEIITNATAARNEAMMISESRDLETRLGHRIACYLQGAIAVTFVRDATVPFASYIEHKRPMRR